MYYEVLYYSDLRGDAIIKHTKDYQKASAYAQKLLKNPLVFGVWFTKRDANDNIIDEYIY